MTRKVRISQAAAELGVSPQTVRNYIGKGWLTGFRRGPRIVLVDMDEAAKIDTLIPTARSATGRKPYGPQANIVADPGPVPTNRRRRPVVVTRDAGDHDD